MIRMLRVSLYKHALILGFLHTRCPMIHSFKALRACNMGHPVHMFIIVNDLFKSNSNYTDNKAARSAMF